ncbi:MAG: hypothetical protein ABFS14_01195 [Gemmatimonadota bacterium]
MKRRVITLGLGLGLSLLVTGGNLWAQEAAAEAEAAVETEAALPAAPHLPADSMEIGAKYSQWFSDGEADSLWAHFTPDFQERRSVDDIRGIMDQVLAMAGIEAEVIEQKYIMRGGMPQFWHTAIFTEFDEALLLRWVITPDGKIGGLGLNPLSAAPEVDPPAATEEAPAAP